MDQQVNATGRPRVDGGKPLYEGRLYSVLRDKLPSEYVHDGRINTRLICKQTGNARFTVYRWFQQERLSPRAISALIKISGTAARSEEKDRLTKEDLIPFLLDI